MRAFVAARFIRPAQAFVHTEASGGIVLLVAALVALVWANSPWGGRYINLWESSLSLAIPHFTLHLSLLHAVNDGLMAVFFFLVGLEIKREVLEGELASPRKAALPIAAAIGGMVVPAAIFAIWNRGGDGARGWGIPMATDIAFALGVLALLGRRAPFSLKVFMLALAIVDDLGAILVIAVFYTGSVSLPALAWAVGLVVLIILVARMGVRSFNVYVFLGALLWVAVYKSGIHATIAGVVLAALTPAGRTYSPKEFEGNALDLLVAQRIARDNGDQEASDDALRQLEQLARETESPLDRLERVLHPWVSYLIVPLFALANAGLMLSTGLVHDAARSPITLGIGAGLVLGKPMGIVLAGWLALRLGIARLPENMTLVHVIGGGLLAGIGFTVSLFIAGLAFDSALLADEARAGIFAASLVAGAVGFVYLWIAPGEPEPGIESARPGAASDEAIAEG